MDAGSGLVADSLKAWTNEATNSSARFHPTMGTVTALVESGQLRLVRSDSLRQSILRYHSAVAGAIRTIDGLNPPMWRALDRMGEVVSLSSLVAPDDASPFQNNWGALSSNRAFHDALYRLRLVSQNRLFALRPLQQSLQELQAELDGTSRPSR